MGQRGRPRHPDVLTPREQDVLALIRDGLTNEQIAERLNIGFETAKSHVAEVLSKLGVATREEAAAWQPEAEPRWSFGRIVLAVAGTSVFVAAVTGLALLSWGLQQSGNGDESQANSAAPSPIVSGVYYLPPAHTTDWIATPDLVAGAGIHVVDTGAELMQQPTRAMAIIIDRERLDEIDRDWLRAETQAGTVIVGGRINLSLLLPRVGAGPADPASSDYPSNRNFYSMYHECHSDRGGSHDESEDYLDVHQASQFRLMLSRIQHSSVLPEACRSGSVTPSPTPAAPSAAPAGVAVPNLLFRSLWMKDANNGWIGGATRGCQEQTGDCAGVIYHTSDGGQSWEAQYDGDVQVTGIAFDGQLGFAVGTTGKCEPGSCDSGLLRTTDGGQNWTDAIRTGRQLDHLTVIDGDAWVLAYGCDPGDIACTGGTQLLASADSGASWNESSLPDSLLAADISRPTANDAWVVTSPQGPGTARIIVTHDGGRRWQGLPQPENGAGFEQRIFFLTAAQGWLVVAGQPGAGSQYKEVFATSDGGQTWAHLTGSLAPTASGVPGQGIPVSGYLGPVVFTSDFDGWMASPRFGLLNTTDGGANWSQSFFDDNLSAVQFASPNYPEQGWTLSLVALWKTTDGGANWQSVAPPDEPATPSVAGTAS